MAGDDAIRSVARFQGGSGLCGRVHGHPMTHATSELMVYAMREGRFQEMRNLFAGSILTTATMLAVFSLALTPAAGQGQQKGAAKAAPNIILPKAGSPPAPRLPD